MHSIPGVFSVFPEKKNVFEISVLGFDVIARLETIALLQLHYALFQYSVVKYFDFMIACNIQNEGCYFTAKKILENFFPKCQ